MGTIYVGWKRGQNDRQNKIPKFSIKENFKKTF